MGSNRILTLAVCSALWAGVAQAQNEDMAKLQTVPAGERVANYLQVYLTKLGTIVEAKSSGGILEGAQTYRVTVGYDPDKEGLDVAVIGMAHDPEATQKMLGVIEDIILKANPRLQKYFGVSLQEKDLAIDYLYAKTGEVEMRLRDGKYIKGPAAKTSPTPEPASPAN